MTRVLAGLYGGRRRLRIALLTADGRLDIPLGGRHGHISQGSAAGSAGWIRGGRLARPTGRAGAGGGQHVPRARIVPGCRGRVRVRRRRSDGHGGHCQSGGPGRDGRSRDPAHHRHDHHPWRDVAGRRRQRLHRVGRWLVRWKERRRRDDRPHRHRVLRDPQRGRRRVRQGASGGAPIAERQSDLVQLRQLASRNASLVSPVRCLRAPAPSCTTGRSHRPAAHRNR